MQKDCKITFEFVKKLLATILSQSKGRGDKMFRNLVIAEIVI